MENSTQNGQRVGQPRLVRLWLLALCAISEKAFDISSWADNLAIGSKVREAERKALKSNSPEDVERFMDLLYARAAILPEVCSAKQMLAAMRNQVRRRHGDTNDLSAGTAPESAAAKHP